MKFKNPILLILLVPFSAFSQYGSMSFKRFTTDDGLAHNGIVSTAQDKFGRLWISTLGGINVYNGHSFTLFTSENTKGALPSNEIIATCHTRKGNIFFGTSGGGLTEYNFLTNSFTTDTTIKEVVTAILEDHNHILWVATQNSLVHAIDLLTKRKTTFRLEHKVNKKRFSIYKMAEISDSSIWLATDMGVFTITNQKRVTYREEFDQFNITNTSTLVRDLATDGKKIWIATKINGLIEYNISTSGIKHYTTETESIKLSSNNLRNIKFHDNSLWIGTWDAGINVVNTITNSHNYIKHDPFNNNSLSTNYIGNIYFANDSIIWVSTFDGGLHKFDPMLNQFHAVTKTFHADGGLLYSNIKNIHYDSKSETLWLGSLSGGLYVKKKNSERYTNYRFTDSLSSIPHNTVKYILPGKNGNYWIATLGGLGNLNMTTGKCKNFYFKKDNTGLTTNRVFCLANDYTGRLWIGTPSGISIYDEKQNRFSNFYSNIEHKGSFIRGITINYLIEKLFNGKKYMIACTSAGIEVIEIETLTSSIHFFPGENLTTKSEIKQLYAANDTCWWVATGGSGIIKLNPRTGEQIYYTANEGLGDNFVYAVVPDKTGNLWISTNNGLSRFNINAGTFTNYKKSDGLQDNEFNQNSWFLDSSSNTIFFGGVSGYNYFEGNNVKEAEDTKTSLEWKSFKVFDNEYLWSKGILQTKEVTLRQDKENFFEIIFALPSFRNQPNMTLKYQLKGFDKKWHINTGECKASYTNVPAGKYDFIVYLLINKKQILLDKVRITIKPSWYQTLWFKSLIALFFLFLFITVTVKRIKYIRQEANLKSRAIENEIAALKAQMSPHFIFNCLNSIDAFIHNNDKYNATFYLNKFARLLRNILDSSKENIVPFSKDIETLKLYLELEELRHENKFNHIITIEDGLLTNDYKVPPLIIQPFVENAILHGLKNKPGNEGLLQISIKRVNDTIEYTITDNGIGREAAGKIVQSKESSYGMTISYDRIKLFNNEKEPSVTITDLHNEAGMATGTSITIYLKLL